MDQVLTYKSTEIFFTIENQWLVPSNAILTALLSNICRDAVSILSNQHLLGVTEDKHALVSVKNTHPLPYVFSFLWFINKCSIHFLSGGGVWSSVSLLNMCLSQSTFFSWYWGLNSGLHLEPLHQPFFCDGFFLEIGSYEVFAWAGFKLWSSWSQPSE
jgi:hypothetical protein